MSLFDVFFLLSFIGSVVVLGSIVVLALRGHRGKAGRIFLAWAIFAALYLATNFAVSYATTQRILHIGESWCFDDWCLTVDRAAASPAPPLLSYNVQFHISSRALRITQRANYAWIYLVDDRGHLYPPQPAPGQVPLDIVLRPGESVEASRTFAVPQDVHTLGLVTGHGSAYCGVMSVLVIGDGGCWFGKPPMVWIQ
jgi:hypothetical protein